MGLTFSASIDNNNKVTIIQTPGPGITPAVLQADLVFTQQLQELINKYGFTKIIIDMNQLQTYLQNKNDTNINYIQSLNKTLNNSKSFQFTQSLTKNTIPQLLTGIGFIYMMADQFLLIPIIKPTQGQENITLLLPNFFFNSSLINNLDTILVGINPTLPNQLLSKINAIYNVFQTSVNPQLSFINLISMSILSAIIFILSQIPNNIRQQQSPPIMEGDQPLLAAISSDIAVDILDIQINGNNNCNVTSKILTFDNSICKPSISTSTICPPSISTSTICPPTNNTILYISFATIIILFIIIMILLFMKKSN
jgi:hypothetical protein